MLFRYHFHLDSKEASLEMRNSKVPHKKRVTTKFSLINLHDFYYYLFLFFVLLITLGNSVLTYYEGNSYLNKYPDTAKFYKAVSDIGTDVPTMFA